MPGRSIPARAGEPRPRPTAARRSAVYPRPCGGTTVATWCGSFFGGLSPPVRGNPGGWRGPAAVLGSIPARAGEPHDAPLGLSRLRVYPRPCGGTAFARASNPVSGGLSPPVRGNLEELLAHCVERGSIPARAGEPCCAAPVPPNFRVYPRPCGGTVERLGQRIGIEGLSPPVRGNPAHFLGWDACLRSIPARAGEPAAERSVGRLQAVYPRPCGGTMFVDAGQPWREGLSPPVRGNPGQSAAASSWAGSIPARAGEPADFETPRRSL